MGQRDRVERFDSWVVVDLSKFRRCDVEHATVSGANLGDWPSRITTGASTGKETESLDHVSGTTCGFAREQAVGATRVACL